MLFLHLALRTLGLDPRVGTSHTLRRSAGCCRACEDKAAVTGRETTVRPKPREPQEIRTPLLTQTQIYR